MALLKPEVNPQDHHKGNMNAEIILVEYGDLQCPYCKHAHPLVARLLNEWGKELHFVFRHFPLREIHRHAFAAAVATEAAARQNKFWEMHDLIFERQNKITDNYLLILAEEIDLDAIQFSNDCKNEKLKTKIKDDFESGIRSGVNRTPTFFLNGRPVLTYDESYRSLADAIVMEYESI